MGYASDQKWSSWRVPADDTSGSFILLTYPETMIICGGACDGKGGWVVGGRRGRGFRGGRVVEGRMVGGGGGWE